MGFIQSNVKKWLYKDINQEWSINSKKLYKDLSIDISKLRSGDHGIFVFSKGKWKQYSDEGFQRLIVRFFKQLTYKEAGEHIPILPSVLKHIYQSVITTCQNFPDLGTIRNVRANGNYKVITESYVYNIEPKTGKFNQEKNEGQYYNFAALEDFEIDEKPIKLSPTLQKFLDNITKKDKSFEMYLQELVGSCLLNQTSPEPYIYILYGPGKNGKSAFINMLSYIVFHQLSSIEFSQISEQTISNFENKYINCPSEISDKTFNSSILKAITSGDAVGANEKYKDPRTILPISKQIASANKLPSISDSTVGMWRRLQIIPFNLKINNTNKIDENTLTKCFREENNILRTWAFQGLIRFIKNDGEHTKVQEIIKTTKDYEEDENNVHQYLKLFFDFLVDNFDKIKDKKDVYFDEINIKNNVFKFEKGWECDPKIEVSKLYNFYKQWAASQGYKPLSIKNFRHKIKSEFILNINVAQYGPHLALQFIIFQEINKKQKENIPIEVVYNDDKIDF